MSFSVAGTRGLPPRYPNGRPLSLENSVDDVERHQTRPGTRPAFLAWFKFWPWTCGVDDGEMMHCSYDRVEAPGPSWRIGGATIRAYGYSAIRRNGVVCVRICIEP
jgi:hypothetical protein